MAIYHPFLVPVLLIVAVVLLVVHQTQCPGSPDPDAEKPFFYYIQSCGTLPAVYDSIFAVVVLMLFFALLANWLGKRYNIKYDALWCYCAAHAPLLPTTYTPVLMDDYEKQTNVPTADTVKT